MSRDSCGVQHRDKRNLTAARQKMIEMTVQWPKELKEIGKLTRDALTEMGIDSCQDQI
jgi:hypothetical protein